MGRKEIVIELPSNYQTIIDVEKYDLVRKWLWYARRDIRRETIYVSRNNYDNDIYPRALHRLIVQSEGVNIQGLEIDHKDRDGLNNLKENLRIATRSQNCINNKLRKDNMSGYKGVSWSVREQRWKVQIQYNKETICIGTFKTSIEAAKAYNQVAKRLFKEFAWLNEID